MVIIVVVLIGIVFLALMFVFGSREDHELREKIIKNGERIGDDEYVARMPFLSGGQERGAALRLRATFAGIAKVPHECIIPEMLIDDVFRAQCFILYDGIDLAELVMELEDCFDIEIHEDDCDLPFSDDDTVAALTHTFMQYACARGILIKTAT